MWTQFSFLVTQLNCNYRKCKRIEKWEEWSKNDRGSPGLLLADTLAQICPILRKETIPCTWHCTTRGRPAASRGSEENALTTPLRCLKALGGEEEKKPIMYTGCPFSLAIWHLAGCFCVFFIVREDFGFKSLNSTGGFVVLWCKCEGHITEWDNGEYNMSPLSSVHCKWLINVGTPEGRSQGISSLPWV